MRSFDAKAKYLLRAGLGGATLYSLDLDDHFDLCYQGLFPLLKVINFHLNKQVQVDYPNADRLFNLTWEKTIRERDDLNFASSYAASSNATRYECMPKVLIAMIFDL